MANGGELLIAQQQPAVEARGGALTATRPRLRSCACQGCLAILTVLKALLLVVLPVVLGIVCAPAGYELAFGSALVVTAVITLLLCLAFRKDATVRWLYAYVVGWWIGFRGISHVLSACLPGVCGLPCGWRTYAATLWYVQGAGVKGLAALTIDDCPSGDPTLFAELLDTLKRHGVRATLMVITDLKPGMRPLLERAIAEGHELGNHMPKDRSYAKDDAGTFHTELRKSKAAIAAIYRDAMAVNGEDAVVPPPWFRAPKGFLSEAMMPALSQEGYQHVLGDVHSNDFEFRWKAKDVRLTDYHVDYILRTTQRGSIIIVHCPSGWLPNATEIVERAITGLRCARGPIFQHLR